MQCSHETLVLLLHTLQMYLGEGPRFIAIEIDLGAINKLKNILITKFHLRSDFLALASSDPSQRNVIFRLADCISPEDVANISEVRQCTSQLCVLPVIMCSLT